MFPHDTKLANTPEQKSYKWWPEYVYFLKLVIRMGFQRLFAYTFLDPHTKTEGQKRLYR